MWTKRMAVVTAAATMGIAGMWGASAAPESRLQQARCAAEAGSSGESSPRELARVAKLTSELAHLESLRATADKSSPARFRLQESSDAIRLELEALTC